MSHGRRRVVLTGAAGTIAGLLPAPRERYDLLPLDIRTTNRLGKPIAGLAVAE
ncbi:MAG: hypothetical protein R6X16_01600 [Anaerolineae bacterium]